MSERFGEGNFRARSEMDRVVGRGREFEAERWDTRAYLEHYFPPDVDCDPTMEFVVRAIGQCGPIERAIDVGCGPVVCYWMALARKAKELHLADFVPQNLREQALWVDYASTAYNWQPYTELLLQYEQGIMLGTASDEIRAARDMETRRKVGECYHCDVMRPDPISPELRYSFDCVMSLYCADSITSDKTRWREYMRNIFSLLQPGGLFIGGALYDSAYYRVGDTHYPSARIREDDVVAVMRDFGFDEKSITMEVRDEGLPPTPESRARFLALSDYTKDILFSGRLKA